MIVCVCERINDQSVRHLAANGYDTMRLLGNECGLGRQCGRCVPYARSLLKEYRLAHEEKTEKSSGLAV